MATILIVDDRKLDRELLVTLLRYAQHRVLEAAGATEALELVKSGHPDLVISDVLLPEIDGYELVRLMRADPSIVQPAVIFYTSVFNEQEARDFALECGVERVLSKPTDPKEILGTVSDVLGSKGIRNAPLVPADFETKHQKLLVDKLIEQVDALRKARDELDHRVKERTAELESANQQLALSQELSQRTFNEAPIGAAIVDLDYRFNRVNDALCRLTGYSPEELTSLTIPDITYPEDIEATIGQNRRIVAGEIDSFQMEKRYIRKDGSVVWINLSVRLMRDPAGKPLCFLPMMEDITHRKLVEEKLNLYTERLEASNQALQDFASIASHDLQEPLRKVVIFSDRLKARCGTSLDEQACDYVERMQDAARRMQRLLTSLLDYSRVTTCTEPFIPLDLNGLVRDVLSDLEVRIEQTGGRVEVEDLPTVEADPNQMRQVFQNLVSNGLKYVRQGESPLIRIYSECRNSHCRFFFEDNGIGFDEKHLDHIFKPFHRLHGRNEYEGTGIGLAICKKIVERHGGSITARSKPGEGSTFIVTLPSKATVNS